MAALTPEDARARHIRRSDMVACALAFIDCKMPGSERKENYSLVGPGVTQSRVDAHADPGEHERRLAGDRRHPQLGQAVDQHPATGSGAGGAAGLLGPGLLAGAGDHRGRRGG